MSENVVQISTAYNEAQRAWEQWDAARLAFEAMYTDPACSTSQERMAAAMEMQRLWRQFLDLFDRVPS